MELCYGGSGIITIDGNSTAGGNVLKNLKTQLSLIVNV